ncbi:MAG: class I SAM-dependent methyltransferase [Planctomycetes bacterium]|nr:class I SAM-dependent methyltransferase [Planctomycetota bacterium]
MLRIARDETKSCQQGSTATTTAAKAAAGCAGAETPRVESRAPEQKSRQTPLTGNHAARVLPWITEEVRFHSVLDLGSADGEAVRLLQEAGFEAHGIDLAPKESGLANVHRGDFFAAPYDNGYFDLVICCNTLQEIPNHRIPSLLAEIDRLSNSYVMLTTPSTESDEPQGTTREVAWWTDRIRDFGWRYRIIREDPETGQMIILAEKPNSLAAQILPLLDDGSLDPNTGDEAPASTFGATVVAEIDASIGHFSRGDLQSGFASISTIADLLLRQGVELGGIKPLFARIVAAMEAQDDERLLELLHKELRPAVAGL